MQHCVKCRTCLLLLELEGRKHPLCCVLPYSDNDFVLFPSFLVVGLAAVACADDASSFAVLACFPAPTDSVESQKMSHFLSHGIILLFDVNSPVPASTWLVKKVLFFL